MLVSMIQSILFPSRRFVVVNVTFNWMGQSYTVSFRLQTIWSMKIWNIKSSLSTLHIFHVSHVSVYAYTSNLVDSKIKILCKSDPFNGYEHFTLIVQFIYSFVLWQWTRVRHALKDFTTTTHMFIYIAAPYKIYVQYNENSPES